MSKKKRTAPAKSNPPALLPIGLLLMVAGPLAYIALGIVWPLVPPLTNEQQGAAVGRGLASILSVIAGVVLIVLHFVRRR